MGIQTLPFNIQIQFRHMKPSDALRQHILDKLAKMNHYLQHIIDAHVTLDTQRETNRCAIELHFEHLDANIHASSDDMYVAIDLAAHKLKQLLTKWHEKIREHHGKKPESKEVDVAVYKNETEVINEEIEAENRRKEAERFKFHQVIRKEKHLVKTLTHTEALMKMEMSAAPFLVYRGEEDRKLKIIYRLPDDNFGVIELN